MSEWFQKPLRIAAMQCNFEGGREQTIAVPAKWQEMGFNTEQLFHPMADAYSALFDEKQHGALLADYLKETRARGLRVIVYLNVHILGPSIGHRLDWAQQSADCSYPKLYDTYYACCFNGPWRDHYFTVLGSLASYDIDGVFLDGPVVIAGGCHCPACCARFAREFGGDLDKADAATLFSFYQRGRDDFLNESYRRFKAIKPQGIHYMNLPVQHPTASYTKLPDALAYNDLVGTEGGFMPYGPPKDGYLWKPSVAAKVLEAVAPDKPRVIFMAADQKPWSWYAHTPVETQLCIASTVANGAGIWYGLHGATQILESPGGQAARKLMRFLAANESYYEGARSAARVAVLYSLDTERIYRAQSGASDFYGESKGGAGFLGNFSEAFNGVCDALARSSIPFDAITDLALTAEKLARYDCVFLPTSACLSDASIQAIREYVVAGGHIVASFDASLYTPAGERRADFGLGDVFGASYGAGALNYRNWSYFSLASEHPLLAGLALPLYPAPGVVLDVRAREGAQVLANFLGEMAGRYVPLNPPVRPAMVLNSYGEGQSLYLAGTFAEWIASYNPVEYRRLLANAANLWARQPIELVGEASNLELTVRAQGERLVAHLVNYAAPVPRPFERVFPQRGLSLRVRREPKMARALAAGVNCVVRQSGDAWLVDLPEIAEYEVVVIE
jgi:hypothetical protein